MKDKYLIDLKRFPMITMDNTMYIPLTEEIRDFIVKNQKNAVVLTGYDRKNNVLFTFNIRDNNCASVIYTDDDYDTFESDGWSYQIIIYNGIPCLDLEIYPEDCRWFDLFEVSKIIVSSHKFNMDTYDTSVISV